MPNSKIIVFYLICSVFVGSAVGQTLHYDIIKGSKKIGDMSIEMRSHGDTLHYRIQSDVHFKVLLSFDVKYYLEEYFVGGILRTGHAYNTLNEKIQKESVVVMNEHEYVVNLNGTLSKFEKNEISYSVSRLYFEQPVGIDRVFSQQFADFLPLADMGNRMYELESPEGNNYYTYNADGYCSEVKVSRTLATFYFKLTEIDQKKMGFVKPEIADQN